MAEVNRTIGVLGLPEAALAFAQSGVTVYDHQDLRALNDELKASEKDRKSAPVALLVADSTQTSLRAWLKQKVTNKYPVGIFRQEGGPGAEVPGAVDILPGQSIGDVSEALGIDGPLKHASDVFSNDGSISSGVPALNGFDEEPLSTAPTLTPFVDDSEDEVPTPAVASAASSEITAATITTPDAYDPWEEQANPEPVAVVTSIRSGYQVPATPETVVDPWQEAEEAKARKVEAAQAKVYLPEAVEAQLASIATGPTFSPPTPTSREDVAQINVASIAPVMSVSESADDGLEPVVEDVEDTRPIVPIHVPAVEVHEAGANPSEVRARAADDDDEDDYWESSGEVEEFGEEEFGEEEFGEDPVTPVAQAAAPVVQSPAQIIVPTAPESAVQAPVQPSSPVYQMPAPVIEVPVFQAPAIGIAELAEQASPVFEAPRQPVWEQPVQPREPINVAPVAPTFEPPAQNQPVFVQRHESPLQQPPAYQAPAPTAAPLVRPHGEVAIRPRGTIVRNAARPCLYSVGAKGGIGKTTTALLLAEYAATKGLTVAVVDANRGQGDVRTILRLRESNLPTIRELAMGSNPSSVVLSPNTINNHRDTNLTGSIGFALVQAPESDRESVSMVSVRHYVDVVKELRTRADLTIIDTQIVEAEDTSDLFDDMVVPSLVTDENAYCLAITDSAMTSMNNTIDRMGAFRAENVSRDKIMVVLNRVTEFEEKRVGKMLQALTPVSTPMGMIPNEPLVKDAMDRGIIPDVSDIESLAEVYDRILFHVTKDQRFAPRAVAESKAKRARNFLAFFKRS